MTLFVNTLFTYSFVSEAETNLKKIVSFRKLFQCFVLFIGWKRSTDYSLARKHRAFFGIKFDFLCSVFRPCWSVCGSEG